MGKEATKQKIRGEFLRIEKQDRHFRVEYVNENGYIHRRIMYENNIHMLARVAERRMGQLESQLSTTTDEKQIKLLKSKIEWELMTVLWPQMYIAYYKGEGLNKFFRLPENQTKNKVKDELRSKNRAVTKSIEYIPKHKIVKDGVNKMLQSLRQGRPEASLKEAMHVYADQKGNSYESVLRAYYYKSKK